MLFQYLTFTVGLLLLRGRTPRGVLEPNDGRRRDEGFITVPGRKRLTGDKRGLADAKKSGVEMNWMPRNALNIIFYYRFPIDWIEHEIRRSLA